MMGATFTDNGGTIEAMNGGYVSFETVAGSAVTDITTAATTTFTTDATSDIRLGGDIIALRGVITPGSDVHFGGEVLGTNNMVRSTTAASLNSTAKSPGKVTITNGYFNVFCGEDAGISQPHTVRRDGGLRQDRRQPHRCVEKRRGQHVYDGCQHRTTLFYRAESLKMMGRLTLATYSSL